MESLSFEQIAESNPCDGCPAPCCRLHLTPCAAPRTFTDLDFARYTLLFPHTEFVVSSQGDWSLLRWQDCSAFDAERALCALHGTRDKPQVCVYFNPHQCWYKRNFVGDGRAEVYRLDRKRFDVWVREIAMDADGTIVSVPSFERSQEILAPLPIEPNFTLSPALIKPETLVPRGPRGSAAPPHVSAPMRGMGEGGATDRVPLGYGGSAPVRGLAVGPEERAQSPHPQGSHLDGRR